MFVEWIRQDDGLGPDALEHLLDVSVSGGAQSGVKKCITTLDSEDSARMYYAALYGWWLPCATHIEPRGWRWLSVRYILA